MDFISVPSVNVLVCLIGCYLAWSVTRGVPRRLMAATVFPGLAISGASLLMSGAAAAYASGGDIVRETYRHVLELNLYVSRCTDPDIVTYVRETERRFTSATRLLQRSGFARELAEGDAAFGRWLAVRRISTCHPERAHNLATMMSARALVERLESLAAGHEAI